MDSLYWNSLNPRVKLLRTNKLFWNKYAFKVKLYVPGGNYLSSWVSSMYKDIDAITYVQRRLKQHTLLLLQSHYRFNGIAERQEKIDIHQADPTTLQLLKKAKMETDIQVFGIWFLLPQSQPRLRCRLLPPLLFLFLTQ